MKERLLILCLPVFFNLTARCQDRTVVDSLLQQIELAGADTSAVNTYLRLWYQYYRNNDNQALEYAKEAKQMAEEIGYPRGQAIAACRLGSQYASRMELDSAQREFHESVVLAASVEDSVVLASALRGLARIYDKKALADSATIIYLKALVIFERIDDQNAVAMVHNDLGNLYKKQRQLNEGLVHYTKALEIARRINFLPGISACLNNIGASYMELKKYGEALPYLKQALDIKKNTGDRLGEARVLQELGNLYRKTGAANRAHTYYLQSLKLAKELGHSDLIALSRYSLGYNEFEKRNYRQAIYYGELVAAQKGKELLTIAKNREMLAGAYAALNDFEKAFAHSLLAKKYRDSLYNQERVKLSSELEAKYQNEKKQKEIAALNTARAINALKLRQHRNERNYLIGVALLVLLLGILIWSRSRIKARTHRKLKELDEMKSRFFANLSHEFRTSLTLILGPLRELQKESFDGDSQALYQVMQRNSQSLLHMVNQLLDLSKIESDKMPLRARETNLNPFLKPIMAAYHSLAESRQIGFRFRIKENVVLYLDREKMEKVFHNLLSNAFKFTEAGGNIFVDTGACFSKGRQQAFIRITDTGIGIGPTELPRIFDRFYQADNAHTQKYKGTGIGLALTKELVELHRGEIDVISIPGEGTSFTVRLPLGHAHLSKSEIIHPKALSTETIFQKDTGTEFPGTTPEETDAGGGTGTSVAPFGRPTLRPNLLIVEDNADMQAFLIQILQAHYLVTAASNGLEALKKAVELQPDLILSDVMMPEMDGMELCRRLKLDENTSHIPVILLTAKSDKEPRIEGLETGADDYLTKPFDAEELLALLKNRIRQRALLRERFSREITVQPRDIAITSADERFLQKAMEIVECNMADSDFNVKAFIGQMGLGRSQVEAKLKALTGQTPVEFIRIFRLKRAAQKIAAKEDTVSRIAYSVGFNNLSYFAKCFKEQFGQPPSVWSEEPVSSY